MADLQLVHYIEKEQEKGFTEHQITDILLKYGAPKQDIEECFDYIKAKEKEKHMHTYSSEEFLDAEEKESAGTKENKKEENKKPAQHDYSKNIYAVVGVIVLIIIGSFLVMKLAFLNENSDTVNGDSQITTGSSNNSMITGEEHNNTGMKSIITPEKLNASDEARQELFNKLVDECVKEDIQYADKSCLDLHQDDPEACANRLGCEIKAYFRIAMLTKDTSVCDNIDIDSLREECKNQVP